MISTSSEYTKIKTLKDEMQAELGNILSYWECHTLDEINGGFVGRIDENNVVDAKADKGAVLNARILWSFSAAYLLDRKDSYREMADRAFNYIQEYFIDPAYGGVYWALDYLGKPIETKKQVYAIAFTIYGLSEYYHISANEMAKEMAIRLYQDLIAHSYDQEQGGFFEAFTREWSAISDLRLSEKDANEKKTMNTHLHVIEAFSSLYTIWNDKGLKQHIEGLLFVFKNHIINLKDSHLNLFFDEEWNNKSDIISYGHDIEAAWLLQEAAEIIDHHQWIVYTKELALKMAEASIQGLDTDGALWYEYAPSAEHYNKEKHWWVQAEAVVGFVNAWQISGTSSFLNAAESTWYYIKNELIDSVHGEWFWGRAEDGSLMKNEDKAGLWKCPYHNSRACIEIIKRLS